MYVMPHQVTTKDHCPSTRLVLEVVRSTGCKATKAHVTPMWSARPHHLRRLLCSEVVITLPQLRRGSRATGRIACLLLSRVRMCTSHRGLRNIDNQPLYCWSPQRCWSTRALPLLHLHLSRSTLAPPLRHTTFHHRARHRQAVWGVRISVNLSHASASMHKHPPGRPARLWERTGKRHRAGIHFTGQRLYRSAPPTTHHRNSAHTVLLPANQGPHFGWSIEYFGIHMS